MNKIYLKIAEKNASHWSVTRHRKVGLGGDEWPHPALKFIQKGLVAAGAWAVGSVSKR